MKFKISDDKSTGFLNCGLGGETTLSFRAENTEEYTLRVPEVKRFFLFQSKKNSMANLQSAIEFYC